MDYNRPIDLSTAKTVIDRYQGRLGTLIEVLQDIQAAYRYVPQETVDLIAEELGYSKVHIYGVLTFYAQFYLAPRGRHTFRICQGTACHVMGGRRIYDYVSQKLKIGNGETTEDGMFTLERVACLGACGLAPVVQIDDKTFGNTTISEVKETIAGYYEQERKA